MIYADFNGSAPLCSEVVEYLKNRFEQKGPYANPNAIHYLGSKTMRGMEKARKVCADLLGALPYQLMFNSGASESISTVFNHLCRNSSERNIIITSPLEHSATVEACKYYAKNGFTVLSLKSDSNGSISTSELEKLLQENGKRVALVSVMAANNETGVILPYLEVAKLCQQHLVPYLCDTTQLIGKHEFNFAESKIDYAMTSGHKIGALTGTGILLMRQPTKMSPLIFGGGQENGLRGGTQNYIGNETMAIAFQSCQQKMTKLSQLRTKREEFEKKIKSEFPNVVIVGEKSPRLANTTLISYPGIHGQAVQIELEAQNIFVTTSSACSDNEPATSKVLKGMGVGDDIGRGVVRISLSPCSSLDNYDKIHQALADAYRKLGKVKSF
jgi:cysteine desulfurase